MAPQHCSVGRQPGVVSLWWCAATAAIYLSRLDSKLSQADCGGVVNALSEATNTKVDIHRYRIDK